MPHDGIAFVRLVANALIVGERDPAAPTHFREPYVIRRVWRKMIGVPLNSEAACFQNLTELFAKVAVREITARQAARS
jgi:hypothetical protein